MSPSWPSPQNTQWRRSLRCRLEPSTGRPGSDFWPHWSSGRRPDLKVRPNENMMKTRAQRVCSGVIFQHPASKNLQYFSCLSLTPLNTTVTLLVIPKNPLSYPSQVWYSDGSPTRLVHGPSFTFHRGAGIWGHADTGHVTSLDLELVEGSLGQILNLKIQREDSHACNQNKLTSVSFIYLTVWVMSLTVQILSVMASWLTSFHTRESALRLST